MIIVAIALGIAVIAAWLGTIGFARAVTAYDRLHCITFVGVAAVAPVAIAAFVADGVTVRAAKVLLILLVTLIGGAAQSHAIGRALVFRESEHRE